MMMSDNPQKDGERNTVVLIQCTGSKVPDEYPDRDLSELAFPAKFLYDTPHPYFSLMKRYARNAGDEWFILSAKHELLHPDERVREYDMEMSGRDSDEWAELVVDELETEMSDPEDSRIILSASGDYVDPLVPELESRLGSEVVNPFRGMKIGARQGELKRRSEELEAAEGSDNT